MEQRAFAIDPNLLVSVMQSQAGTLEKALLEGVMNSVDAGAKRVKVTLTSTGFTIDDNGRGFKSREEILTWFETFGTPHQEGDATFGRFRMGRGQLMSFARTRWTSGRFHMDVDIRNQGMGYVLTEAAEVRKGCLIEAELYELLTPERLEETSNAFKRLVQYAPIPVNLNGKEISQKPEKAKWDIENEWCYIKLDQDAKELLAYNQGVLVKSYPGYYFGCGGVVVSKKPLMVNFARNDIMEYRCPVWTEIRQSIETGIIQRLALHKELTDDQRTFLGREILRNRDNLPPAALDAKILTDINGKHVSLNDVARARALALECPARSNLSRVVHAKGEALVLSRKTLSRLQLDDMSDLVYRLGRVPLIQEKGLTALALETLPTTHLKGQHDTEYELHQLNAKERAAMAALTTLNQEMSSWLEQRQLIPGIRQLGVGRRAGAMAWTDGKSWIYVNRKDLAQLENGLDGATHWVHILQHEYCHDTDDSESHDHGQVFYNKYHDWTHQGLPIARLALKLVQHYIEALRSEQRSAPRRLLREAKGLV